jgi:hypothetical protein
LLAAARAPVEEMLSDSPKDAGVWQFLGMAAVEEAQKRSGRQPDWLAEADRCLREALRLRPDAAGGLLGHWAAALGLCGMERSGEEAFEFYAQADAKFHESEKIQPDSRALRKNWSGILLRQALEQGGPAELWERAQQQAQQAEAIEPGSGAYNLACMAAELNDREGVDRWLLHAAEYGQMAPLSHTLRDVNFEGIRDEPRFRELLDRIFDVRQA